jgi:hypothetical protein
VVCAGRRRFHDVGGFSLVFATALYPSLDGSHGLRSGRQGKNGSHAESAGKSYAISFLAALVSAFVLGKIVQITTVNSLLYGMKIGFAIWLGFVTTVQLTAKLFGNQSTRLYLINTGYQLVCYLVMGAILAVWPR